MLIMSETLKVNVPFEEVAAAPVKPLLGPPAGRAPEWMMDFLGVFGGVRVCTHVWVSLSDALVFPGVIPAAGQRGHLNPFSEPLLFSTFTWIFWRLKPDCDKLQPLCSRQTCPGSGRVHSPRPPVSLIPPYLACAQIRSREVKDTELLSLCQMTGFGLNRGESWNEATVSVWQHSEAEGFMGSSDGEPAANQRTPPANGSLREKDNRRWYILASLIVLWE